MSDSWLDGLEERARAVLPAPVFGYVQQGARDSTTAAEAVAAWRGLRFRPRVLRDVAKIDTAATACGVPLALPVAVAPTTLQRAAHPDGELAMAHAVAAAGSLLVLSSNAGTSFAEIAATGVAWWLQAYLPQQRERALPMLEAAVAAGCRAVVLTVDTPVVGTKYGDAASVWDHVDLRSLRMNLAAAADDPKASDLGAADVEWLADQTGLPVVVKGVLHPDDAVLAVQAGAAAVWVSNHGGRQLDRAAATRHCLPGVVEALSATTAVEVYVDGGLRNGLDVLGALALGATVGFVGRPAFYALAAGGSAGVERMFAEFRAELTEALALAGAPNPSAAVGLQHRTPTRP